MRFAAGIALVAVGLLLCVLDVRSRIARRKPGGLVRAIWAPAQTPTAYYVGLAASWAGAVLLYGTLHP